MCTLMRLVLPGTPIGVPAVMTIRSPVRATPLVSAASSALSSSELVSRIGGTSTGSTPRIRARRRQVDALSVAARIGALGRNLATERAVPPCAVPQTIAAAPWSCAMVAAASATASVTLSRPCTLKLLETNGARPVPGRSGLDRASVLVD